MQPMEQGAAESDRWDHLKFDSLHERKQYLLFLSYFSCGCWCSAQCHSLPLAVPGLWQVNLSRVSQMQS